MGIKSSAFLRSELPAFPLPTVHREPWMRLTKAFCWTPLGRLPRQQLAGSGVTLTTFIPSRPLAPNTGCQSHKLPAFPLIPRDMSDLSTCFCSIKAISHLANGTGRKRAKQAECNRKYEQRTESEKSEWMAHRERKRERIMELLIWWHKAPACEAGTPEAKAQFFMKDTWLAWYQANTHSQLTPAGVREVNMKPIPPSFQVERAALHQLSSSPGPPVNIRWPILSFNNCVYIHKYRTTFPYFKQTFFL